MMRDLVRFPLADGGELVVEVDDQDPGVGRASRLGDAIGQAAVTYEEALDSVRRAADSTIRAFEQMHRPPSKLEVEFGVRLSGEVGAVMVKAGGDANLTVRLTWSADPAA
jgi:hypothetical protein